MAGAQKRLLFSSLSRIQMRGGKAEREETYEKYELYVGFELNHPASNGTSDGEDCGCARS